MNPQGWYADLVIKYTQLWNYFNAPVSDGISTGFYSIPSFGGSLEMGKSLDMGKFFIEPQAQLAGDKIRQPWAINGGIRLQWGGNSKEAAAVAAVGQPSVEQSSGKQEEAKAVEKLDILNL